MTLYYSLDVKNFLKIKFEFFPPKLNELETTKFKILFYVYSEHN